jgi:hypothetical protein
MERLLNVANKSVPPSFAGNDQVQDLFLSDGISKAHRTARSVHETLPTDPVTDSILLCTLIQRCGVISLPDPVVLSSHIN